MKIVKGRSGAMYLVNDDGIVDSAYDIVDSGLVGERATMVNSVESFVPEVKKEWRPLSELGKNTNKITTGSELWNNGQRLVVVVVDGHYALMTEHVVLSTRYRDIGELVENCKRMIYHGVELGDTKKIKVGLVIRRKEAPNDEYVICTSAGGEYALVNITLYHAYGVLNGNLNYGLLLDMIGGGADKWEYAV